MNNKTSPVSETTNGDVLIEKIIGATNLNERLEFLVKRKNIVEPQLISAEELNILCPQMVIAFYEARYKWSEPESR